MRRFWGQQPPFWFVRLSFAESRERNKQDRLAGSNQAAALLSLTLSLAVTLVNALVNASVKGLMLVTLVSEVLASRTTLGIFFRLHVLDFDVFCLFLVSHFVICPLLAC